jgi:hypothetical protein
MLPCVLHGNTFNHLEKAGTFPNIRGPYFRPLVMVDRHEAVCLHNWLMLAHSMLCAAL